MRRSVAFVRPRNDSGQGPSLGRSRPFLSYSPECVERGLSEVRDPETEAGRLDVRDTGPLGWDGELDALRPTLCGGNVAAFQTNRYAGFMRTTSP